jgi:hypothetical protein
MARSPIPNPLERRHAIERDLAPARALSIGEAYLEQGREIEAIEFLRKGEAAERLAELRARAIERGDGFLLRAVARATSSPPGRDEWKRLAEAARAAGKERYALDATRQAERGEE